MILLSLAAATAMTHFAAGNPNDLAKSIFDATGQSVVIYQARPQKLDSFDYDPASLDEFARTMRAKPKLMLAPGIQYIFSDGFLPPSKMPVRFQGRLTAPAPSNVSPPADALKEGKVTFVTKGNDAMPLSALTSLGFSKKVTVSPYVADMAVFVQAKDLPEADFLTYVSKAVGARLSIIKDQYNIVVDGAEIRTRALRNIEDRLKTASKDDSERAHDQLLAGALSAALPTDLADMLSKQSGELQVQLTSGSTLGNLAIARINSVEKARNAGADNPAPSILGRLDPRTPSYAVITPGLEVILDLAVRGGGRGGSRVRM